MKKRNLVFTIIAAVSVLLMILAAILGNSASLPLALIGATSLFVIGIMLFICKKDNKIIRIILLTTVYLFLLSYIIPGSYYSDTVTSVGLTRMSLYELILYPYNTLFLPNSFQAFLLILVVGGFYGVLEKTGKIKGLLEKIAKSLKGNELLFLGVISFLFAVLTSVFGLHILLFVFIPFVVSLLLLLGFDKLTALLATFISPLIGVIGSTYSGNIALIINEGTSTVIKDGILFKVILLLVCYGIYLFFLIRQAKRSKNKMNEVKEQLALTLGEEKGSSKKPAWPIVVILSVLCVIFILGYTDWTGVFNTDAFTKAFESVTTFEIAGHPIFGYLLGSADAFGTWSYQYTGVLNYQNAIILLIVASILVSLIYSIKADEAISSFAKGAKKVFKGAILVMIAYMLLFIDGNHAMLATVIDFIMNLFKNTTGFIRNTLFVITSSIFTALSTFLHIDTYYTVQLATAQLNSYFSDLNTLLAIITSAFHGLAMIFVPTSSMLILGLSYLGISYKEWMKSSWKLLVALLAAIFVIITIMAIVVL